MAVGQVSFHNDKRVKRVYVPKRENVIVNRLNKTKVEREVDHEAERIERVKQENAVRRAAAAEKRKADAELAKAREAEKSARSYDNLFDVAAEDDEDGLSQLRKTGRELEEDFM
jgi:DNA repair exonuclease SbcCD nuclease subunit